MIRLQDFSVDSISCRLIFHIPCSEGTAVLFGYIFFRNSISVIVV
jgi:hypothetical protein